MKRLITTLSIAVLVIPVVLLAADYPAVPESGYYVADTERKIESYYEEGINDICREVKLVTDVRMGVLTISSTDAEDIASYASSLRNDWFGEESSLLLVVVMDDHQIATAVTDDLALIFTESRISHVRRRFLIPNFKEREYGRGIYWAMREFAKYIEAVYDEDFESLDDVPDDYYERDYHQDRVNDACVEACIRASCFLGWHWWWWEHWDRD